MARTLALTALVSLGMITLNFNFSYANGQIPVFNSQPTLADLQTSPVYIKISTRNFNSYFAVSNSTDVDYFYALVNSSPTVYVVSKTNQNYNIYRLTYSQSVTTDTAYKLNNSYSIYGFEYSYSGTVEDSTIPYLGTFNNLAGVFDYYLANGVDYPSYTPATTYNYTLQNGWLSVIDLGSASTSYNLDLSTQFAEYSHLSEPWWNSTQIYWFSSSLPAEDDSFDNDTQGTLISWNKTGKTDIFGRAKSAEANISGTSTAKYLYIYNPAYHTFQGLTSANDEANFPMVISGIAEGTDIYIYSTTEQYHLTTGPSTTIGNTTATTTATGSALDVTDTFEYDGQYISQNSGGGNDLNNSTGIVGYIMNINNVLDNFTNSIIQLLSAPISHIQQLVSAGTSFFSVFGQLFSSWLPAEVSSVIISALVVMIVIGVIKMLL